MLEHSILYKIGCCTTFVKQILYLDRQERRYNVTIYAIVFPFQRNVIVQYHATPPFGHVNKTVKDNCSWCHIWLGKFYIKSRLKQKHVKMNQELNISLEESASSEANGSEDDIPRPLEATEQEWSLESGYSEK